MVGEPAAYLEGRYDLAAEIMAVCDTEEGSFISKGGLIQRLRVICDRADAL